MRRTSRLGVVLAMPRTLAMDDATPPLGLLMLAAVAEPEHDVRVIFPVDLDAAVAALPDSLAGTDVLGLSVNSFSWRSARTIAAMVRRHFPRMRIVLGGPHPTQYPRHCLESSAADAVVRGEAEITFPELLRAWAKGEEPEGIAGVTWKSEDGEIQENPDRALLTEAEMNDLPLPAYRHIPPGRHGFVPVETSRGCNFRCVFCAVPRPRGVRQFSLERTERTLKLLDGLRDRFTLNAIFLSDDSFSAHKDRAEGTLRLVREINPSFVVGCEARISEILRHDLLPELARTPLYLVQVGVECGYEEGLRRVRKGLTGKMIAEFSERVSRLPFRYHVYWSFIIGFPWETEREVMQTIHFAFDVARRTGSQQPQVNPFSPYPGSTLVEQPEEFGLQPVGPTLYDEAAWFSRFLQYSRVSEENRPFVEQYLLAMHGAYPNYVPPPAVRMPSGMVV